MRQPLVKIHFKSMVAFEELTTPILFALQETAQVMVAQGVLCVITSGNDRSHRTGSDHYVNDAFDVRTRDLKTDALHRIHDMIKRRVGPCFKVINEGDHYHVAYRPYPAKKAAVVNPLL